MARGLPEVVAGRGALARRVRWVHVLDVEDPSDLLRGGELVLSTGRGPAKMPAANNALWRRSPARAPAAS